MCLFTFDILFGLLVLYLAHLFHSAAPTASPPPPSTTTSIQFLWGDCTATGLSWCVSYFLSLIVLFYHLLINIDQTQEASTLPTDETETEETSGSPDGSQKKVCISPLAGRNISSSALCILCLAFFFSSTSLPSCILSTDTHLIPFKVGLSVEVLGAGRIRCYLCRRPSVPSLLGEHISPSP